MNDRFESLESGEVISVQRDTQVLVGHRTFRVGELNDAIKDRLEQAIGSWTEDKNDWFSDQGIDCEALRFGSNGWQKGRIRLCLEFCPDESSKTAHGEIDRSIPTLSVVPPTTHSTAENSVLPVHGENTQKEVTEAQISQTPVAAEPIAFEPTSAAGIFAGGAVAAAAVAMGKQFTTPDINEIAEVDSGNSQAFVAFESIARPNPAPAVEISTPTDRPSIPAVAVVNNSDTTTAPSLTDAILELEENPIAASADVHESMEEISFDFDRNNDRLGTMVPNGMMELDLTDLDRDGAEHDYLNFETGDMPDSPQQLANLHELGRSENSGMLIDEVWSEMGQPNWPGIH
jgi:KGK domain